MSFVSDLRDLSIERFERRFQFRVETRFCLLSLFGDAERTLLKLKPVLQIQGEKLDAFSKARTTGQGKSVMINAIKNDIETRFGGLANAKDDVTVMVAHTQNLEAAQALSEELKSELGLEDVFIAPLSLSVSCHIGPGSLAIACCQKMEYN